MPKTTKIACLASVIAVIVGFIDFAMPKTAIAVSDIPLDTLGSIIFNALFTIVLLLFIAHGHNWARWVYVICISLGIPLIAPVLLKEIHSDPIRAMSTAIQMALFISSVILLFSKSTREWFANRLPVHNTSPITSTGGNTATAVYLDTIGRKNKMMHFLFSAKGRLNREPYNLFMIATVGGFYILGGLKDDPSGWSILFLIAIFWPSVVIQIKRWHDRAKSGNWFFINIIPFVGSIWAFIETCFLPGTVGENQYGPDPLAQQGGAVDAATSAPRH